MRLTKARSGEMSSSRLGRGRSKTKGGVSGWSSSSMAGRVRRRVRRAVLGRVDSLRVLVALGFPTQRGRVYRSWNKTYALAEALARKPGTGDLVPPTRLFQMTAQRVQMIAQPGHASE